MNEKEKSESENLKDVIRHLSEEMENLKKRVKSLEEQVTRQKAMRRWV